MVEADLDELAKSRAVIITHCSCIACEGKQEDEGYGKKTETRDEDREMENKQTSNTFM